MRINSSIKTCIIPAGGKGTRWSPLSNHIPKEMLPLNGRPVIELVVREAIESGCTDIVIFINKEKQVIEQYLLSLKDLGKEAKLHFIYKRCPKGIVQTILVAEKHIKDSFFVLAFPDLPAFYQGNSPLHQLIDKHQKNNITTHAFAFSPYPEKTASFFEYKVSHRPDGLLNVEHLCPNPRSFDNPHHPENNLMPNGRNIYHISIIPMIKECLKQNPDQEVSDYQVVKLALEQGHKIIGAEVDGYIFDTGNPTGYAKATKEWLQLTENKK